MERVLSQSYLSLDMAPTNWHSTPKEMIGVSQSYLSLDMAPTWQEYWMEGEQLFIAVLSFIGHGSYDKPYRMNLQIKNRSPIFHWTWLLLILDEGQRTMDEESQSYLSLDMAPTRDFYYFPNAKRVSQSYLSLDMAPT